MHRSRRWARRSIDAIILTGNNKGQAQRGGSVFMRKIYTLTSVALISMPTRAQNNGTSQQENAMLIHIATMA